MRMITSLRYRTSNDAAHSAAWQIRETRRRAPRPPETHVEALWLSRAQPERVFRSMNGESVRVLRTGERNRHEGPDYLHALVVRDGVLYRGSIEIHVEADDWWRHGHASDARYRDRKSKRLNSSHGRQTRMLSAAFKIPQKEP